jgi:AcrR family transcriptional regulator
MTSTSHPLSRRREQGARTRDRVLAAATDLMAERGYSGTTISAISKASGVMPASIYWHFESKEGLLAAVIDRAAERWFQGIAEVLAQQDAGEGSEPPAFAGLHYVLEQQPGFWRVLLLIALERPDRDAATLAAVKRVRERCRERIIARLGETFPLEDPREREIVYGRMAALFLMLLDGIFVAEQIDPSTPQDLVERFEQLTWVMQLAREACLSEVRAERAGGVRS